MRVCPDRDTVVSEQIDAIVYRPGEHIVWCVAGDDRKWVSIELSPLSGQRTELTVQVMLPHVDAGLVGRRLTEVAAQIGRHLSHRPARLIDLDTWVLLNLAPISIAVVWRLRP